MGLLDRLRNSFRKEETVKEVELSLDEIIARADKKIEEAESEAVAKAYESVEKTAKELEALSVLIDNLEKLSPEGVMQAPKAVKKRFCSYSKNQIASIKTPPKELAAIKEFLNRTYTTVHNLGGLTQKQIMHIEFFFKEDFRPVIKKSREISDIIDEARQCIRAGNTDAYRKIKDMHKNMQELDRSINENNSRVAVIHSGIERLRNDQKELSDKIDSIDTGDFRQYSNEIDEAEKKTRLIEQDLASYLSIEKLLKKLVHEKEMKNELLDAYTESPVKALLQDEEMKIMGFVKEALELHKKGSIDVDEKKIEKATNIIGNPGYLKEQRKRLLEAMKETDKKKEHMNKIIMPRLESKEALEEEKSRVGSDIKKLEESLTKIPKEIEGIEQQKKLLKEQIEGAASEIMKAKIRIK